MTDQEYDKILAKASAQLSEHFDCVQILAAIETPEGSICFSECRGLVEAGLRLCEEQVIRANEELREGVRNDYQE